MKKIKLTQGQYALVSDRDYDKVKDFKYHAKWNKDTQSYYARRWDGSMLIALHFDIMGNGVDHKSRETLDCRRRNLRWATHSDNACNRKKQCNNTSGYKGVSLVRGRWRACIYKDRKQYILGYFSSRKKAARAYDKAAKKLHGEFAVLNFS